MHSPCLRTAMCTSVNPLTTDDAIYSVATMFSEEQNFINKS